MNDKLTELYGIYDIPPDDVSRIRLPDGLVYGCPLCHMLNPDSRHRDNDCCYQYDPVEENFLKIRKDLITCSPTHGTFVNPFLVSGDTCYSVGMTHGHVYYVPCEYVPQLSDMTRYDGMIQLSLEHLKCDTVFVCDDKVYLVPELEQFVVPPQLIHQDRLSKKYEEFITKAETRPEEYSITRNLYLDDINPSNDNKALKLNTFIGLQSFKIVAENLEYPTIGDSFEFHRLGSASPSAFGVVYKGSSRRHPDTKVLFKYQKLDEGDHMFLKEVNNNKLININLDMNPLLPYPYTFKSYFCNQDSADISDLKSTSCMGKGKGFKVGVIVMEEIENAKSLYSYLSNKDINLDTKLSLYLDALTILGHSHIGDIAYNFMHLDAHTQNFLITDCNMNQLTCSPRQKLAIQYGDKTYTLGSTGLTTYLIDFGMSYFPASGKQENLSADFNDTHFDGQIYSAYDFITTSRSALIDIFLETAMTEEEQARIINIMSVFAMTTYKNSWTLAKDVLSNNRSARSEYIPARIVRPNSDINVHVDVKNKEFIDILSDYVNQPSEYERQIYARNAIINSAAAILEENTAPLKRLIDVLSLFLNYYIDGDKHYRTISQRKLCDVYINSDMYEMKNVLDFVFYVNEML